MEIPFSTLGKSQNYSFGKSARFAERKGPQGREFLNFTDPYKTRSTSFGYGQRSVLLNQNSIRTPSPAAYSITPEPGMFHTIMPKPNFQHSFDRNSKLPGPGSYSPESKPALFHTFALSKRELFEFKDKYPGPGAYNPGNKVFGKVIGGFVAKANKSVPIKDKKKKSMPGPGAYKIISCFGESKLLYPVIKYKKK